MLYSRFSLVIYFIHDSIHKHTHTHTHTHRASLVAQTIKYPLAMQETQDSWVGKNPLEKGMATHSSNLA